MKFITETGSVYEVNTDSKQIRRLTGVKDPSPRQGKDGEWKSYLDTTEIKVGNQVLISWADVHPYLPETVEMFKAMGQEVPPPTAGRNTLTSRVVEIQP